jgi:hypothetical protein
MDMFKKKFEGQVIKVSDDSLGLVFGYAIICLEDGKPYYDSQDDHIPEESMLKAATNFMLTQRAAKEMHTGDPIGSIVFAWPLTTDIAERMGIQVKNTGLMIAMKPSKEVFEKFKSGEYTGFSIGGQRIKEDNDDDIT